jgi:hypothetical protein
MNSRLCTVCTRSRGDPLFRWPTHVVHPEHGKRSVSSVYDQVICRQSQGSRHRRDNTSSILP